MFESAEAPPGPEVQSNLPLNLSVGAGIAIVGMWVSAASLTGFLFWGVFLSGKLTATASDGFGAIILLVIIVVLIASPMTTAATMIRYILKRKS